LGFGVRWTYRNTPDLLSVLGNCSVTAENTHHGGAHNTPLCPFRFIYKDLIHHILQPTITAPNCLNKYKKKSHENILVNHAMSENLTQLFDEGPVSDLSIKVRGPVMGEQVVVPPFPQRVQDWLKLFIWSKFA